MYIYAIVLSFLVLPLFAQLTIQDDFELLAGKNTERWHHIETAEDLALLQKYKDLYEKNKDLQFHPPSQEYKIPKVVHFIWIGPRNFPRESIKNIRTWMAQHPDWTFKFWTDRPRPAPCKGMETVMISDFTFQRLKPCYDAAENWSEKADILTYEILSQEGGVYADHDANALQPFDKLNQAYDFYGCLETPQQRISGFTLTAGHGLIGAKARHPIIEKCIDVIERRWNEVYGQYAEKDIHHEISRIMNGSYIALSFALQDSLEKEGNMDIVFPASYFFAQSGLPSFYSQHFFGSTWLGSMKKTDFQKQWREDSGKIRKSIRNVYTFDIAALGVLFISFFYFIFKGKKRSL